MNRIRNARPAPSSRIANASGKRAAGLIMAVIFIALFAAGCKETADREKILGLPELTIEFAEPGWNGKTIPLAQQCNRFGGQGSAPSLKVSDIPPEADALILEYSDKMYPPLDDGGMGVMGYLITPGETEAVVPSVPGHTFDLPRGFYCIYPHRNPKWDISGAYLPPCSGGEGHFYYAMVKAVVLESKDGHKYRTLAKGKIDLGYD